MPSLFQLASGSLRSSYRCLPAGLVAIDQTTMVPNREGTSPGANPTSTDSPPGTSLEDSAMVPTPTVDGSGMPLPSQGGHPGQSTNDTNSTSLMEYLRKRYRDQELSEEATTLMIKSWRAKTNTLFGRWYSWCNRREADPFSGPITDIVNFLATLHQQGYQYNSINSYRSAISSVHEKVEGYNIGQHPTVTRLLKGIFHDRPPLPRYASTWNVESVLSYIRGLGSNQDLSLKQITWKTTMLLALTRPSRSADVS